VNMLDLVSGLLLLGGAVLGIGGGIGLLRFPDFYTRLHAAGVTDTLCAGLFLSGLALQFGFSLASAKLAMIFFFLLFTSPTGCNALARTAWRAGLVPWVPADAERKR
jgi:multicomponent Na+:H+ antiporter subunit G